MTAEEHIITWIESSQPYYRKLLHISVPGNFIRDTGVLCLENEEQRQARLASEKLA